MLEHIYIVSIIHNLDENDITMFTYANKKGTNKNLYSLIKEERVCNSKER